MTSGVARKKKRVNYWCRATTWRTSPAFWQIAWFTEIFFPAAHVASKPHSSENQKFRSLKRAINSGISCETAAARPQLERYGFYLFLGFWNYRRCFERGYKVLRPTGLEKQVSNCLITPHRRTQLFRAWLNAHQNRLKKCGQKATEKNSRPIVTSETQERSCERFTL